MGYTNIHFRPSKNVPSVIEVLLVRICCAIVSLLLLRGLVEKLGTSIGSAISASRFSKGLAWLVTIFYVFLLCVDSHVCLLVGHVGGRFCARVRGQTDRSMAGPASRKHNVRRNRSPVSCHQNNSVGQPIENYLPKLGYLAVILLIGFSVP
jgi:hypothetical protein